MTVDNPTEVRRQRAVTNIEALCEAAGIIGYTIQVDPGSDSSYMFKFALALGDHGCTITMPSFPLEQVQNTIPSLRIDGEPWVWARAVSVIRAIFIGDTP